MEADLEAGEDRRGSEQRTEVEELLPNPTLDLIIHVDIAKPMAASLRHIITDVYRIAAYMNITGTYFDNTFN